MLPLVIIGLLILITAISRSLLITAKFEFINDGDPKVGNLKLKWEWDTMRHTFRLLI